ncbi:hypothetical protein HDU98_002108 [Podochytrium sp. JEL0797]|nr:hypothetical protein HDU98_002108 [Podochytrium sp. JEL0797]
MEADHPTEDSPAHHHNGDEEEWDAEKHGGMSREALREYADKLDLEIRQMPLDNVYDSIQSGTHVLFYGAVFCPFTQQFTAIWLNMQYALDFYHLNETETFTVAKVQCADNQPLCFHMMRDDGFPTIVLYHQGRYISEFKDRDNVLDFVQQQVAIVKDGKQLESWGHVMGSEESLVTLPEQHSMDAISHNQLEAESIGGAVGITETVVPVELIALFVGVIMFSVFVIRRSAKRSYAPIRGRE